jgi:addiction module RelE/StbE family toxin
MDRDGIFDYIEAENPRAAVIVDGRISARLRRLEQFPESGRRGRIAGTRKLVISGTPYFAACRVTDTTVLILRILHGAQLWPEDFAGREHGRPLYIHPPIGWVERSETRR